jgi:exodeoxyribonuclease VII small subunit
MSELDTLPYQEAVKELETILKRIEGEGVDLDALARDVERAAVLITLCRERIRSTEAQVRTVVAELEEASS